MLIYAHMKNIISVFSNYTRIKIISCLLEKDRNVSDLIRKCGLSQSAVSQHLKKLRDLGVVACQADGRDKIYQLKNREIGDISQKILKLIENS